MVSPDRNTVSMSEEILQIREKNDLDTVPPHLRNKQAEAGHRLISFTLENHSVWLIQLFPH